MSLFEIDGWGLEGKSVKKVGGKKSSGAKIRRERREKNKKRLEQETNGEENDKKNDVSNNHKAQDSSKKRKDHDSKFEGKEDKKIKRSKTVDTENDTNIKDIRDVKSFNKPSYVPLNEVPEMPTDINTDNLTPLQKKMLNKLSGSRFRWINEQLYTTNSEKALDMITKQPELFDEYHKGFASQVEAWPENPVDLFIKQIVFKGVSNMINAPGGLPGVANKNGKKVVVADMGCGEANLAVEVDKFMESYKKDSRAALKTFKKKFGGNKEVTVKNKKLEIEVHSFDLKKINEKITVADIKNVPLKDHSVSIVIFCLSLMGTNFLDFIQEADRILIPRGEIWITEIKSRLADPKGESFIKAMDNLGFRHRLTDDSNKMFTKFEFFKPIKRYELKDKELQEKRKEKPEGEWLLKPCIYKRR